MKYSFHCGHDLFQGQSSASSTMFLSQSNSGNWQKIQFTQHKKFSGMIFTLFSKAFCESLLSVRNSRFIILINSITELSILHWARELSWEIWWFQIYGLQSFDLVKVSGIPKFSVRNCKEGNTENLIPVWGIWWFRSLQKGNAAPNPNQEQDTQPKKNQFTPTT